jgi:hypothetical protein
VLRVVDLLELDARYHSLCLQLFLFLDDLLVALKFVNFFNNLFYFSKDLRVIPDSLAMLG